MIKYRLKLIYLPLSASEATNGAAKTPSWTDFLHKSSVLDPKSNSKCGSESFSSNNEICKITSFSLFVSWNGSTSSLTIISHLNSAELQIFSRSSRLESSNFPFSILKFSENSEKIRAEAAWGAFGRTEARLKISEPGSAFSESFRRLKVSENCSFW